MEDLVNGYFVSTKDTPDKGLETMVFKAEPGAHKVSRIFYDDWVGVDWSGIDKYTRHYATQEEAEKGHRETVKSLLHTHTP